MHSHTRKFFNVVREAASLNPCCNGRCTRTHVTKTLRGAYEKVLILVVMEDALALKFSHSKLSVSVLILVVMEDALALT